MSKVNLLENNEIITTSRTQKLSAPVTMNDLLISNSLHITIMANEGKPWTYLHKINSVALMMNTPLLQ